MPAKVKLTYTSNSTLREARAQYLSLTTGLLFPNHSEILDWLIELAYIEGQRVTVAELLKTGAEYAPNPSIQAS